MKDILASLLEVASADNVKSQSPTKTKGGKKGKARANEQADKTPFTVTRDHPLSMFELSPSILRSTHVASVEKFIAHQHLYELPPREERVHMLEERLEQQNKVLATVTSSKTPATAVFPSLPAALTAPASPNKEAPTGIKTGITSPTRASGMDFDKVTVHEASSYGKAKDLAFELFPEIPASTKSSEAAPGPSSPVKKQKKVKNGNESGSSGDETEIPLAASIPSVPVAAPAVNKPADITAPSAKDTAGKEKNTTEKAKKESQRGRFGIWKLLGGILEGGTGGSQPMQSNHRFQHQSVM